MTLYRCMISDIHDNSYVLFSTNLISNTSLHVGRPLLRPFLVAYAEATLARQKKIAQQTKSDDIISEYSLRTNGQLLHSNWCLCCDNIFKCEFICWIFHIDCCTVKVWGWISNCIPYTLMAITRCVDGTPTSEVMPSNRYLVHPPTPAWSQKRSLSWSWMINSHYFVSMLINSPIAKIKLFQILTFKIQGQCHGCGQRNGHIVGPVSTWSVSFLFHIHQTNNSW